jgi:prepilin-type N-terminal cleavage/methylation domain-containing protein
MTARLSQHLRKMSARSGFTILELLVASAVLSLLVVLVAQMVGGASLITSGSRKRMAADEEARMVFDRMASDFARMVKREDVDNLFVAGPGNDTMYFYSEAPAFYTNSTNNSPVALVGYRLNNRQIERYGEGKTWDDLTFLTRDANGTVNPASRISTNALSTNNFQVISPSVFRMEYVFLMKPGTTNAAGGTNGTGAYSQTNVVGAGLKDVSAVVVTLAVLDEASRKIVDTNALGTIASTMADASAAPPGDLWSASVAGSANLPARAATRIYQRYFPINP